jgi:hypothetical protein
MRQTGPANPLSQLLLQVLRGTLVTRPMENGGYEFTLASRLGDMLHEVQERFGPRDRSFTILGVEFEADGPRTWYPVPERKNIIIQLSLEAVDDERKAVFQLAHECVHLLSPALPNQVTLLEEGLASHFSVEYVRTAFNMDCSLWVTGRYAEAMAAADALLRLEPTAIRTLRAREPMISQITATMLREACPALPQEAAQSLAQLSGKMR